MIAAHYVISCKSVLVGDSVEQRKLIIKSSSDSCSKCRPIMSPKLLHLPVYIAVDSAIGDAIGRGRKPHAMPNMVMHYFERPPKISQFAAVPRVLKFKHLNLNKGVRVA